MSFTFSSIKGFTVEASEEALGLAEDLLFNDVTWRVRWLVVDIGSGPRGRLVLIHPTVIERIDWMGRSLRVCLTATEVGNSPDILLDEPVSRQIEYGQGNRSDWEPALGHPRFVAGFWGGMGVQVSKARLEEEISMHKAIRGGGETDAGSPHLRSVDAVLGNDVHATDGPFGHVREVLVEDRSWTIGAVVVDTHHWWPGLRLAVPVSAVRDISWPHQEVRLGIDRDAAKGSPAWDDDASG